MERRFKNNLIVCLAIPDEVVDLNVPFFPLLLSMRLSSETYFFITDLLKLLKNLYLRP